MKRQLSNGVFEVCPHCDKAMAKVCGRDGIVWFCIFCGSYVNGAMKCNRCNRSMKGTTAYDGACACGGLIANATEKKEETDHEAA